MPNFRRVQTRGFLNLSFVFFLVLLLALLTVFLNPVAHAERGDSQSGFLAVWRLMNSEQKQQFIAGYLQGWRDANKVTDIAIQYVRDHPEKAIEGLEKIRTLYDLGEPSPNALVPVIDAFYSQSENQNASFSSAMTAARQALR